MFKIRKVHRLMGLCLLAPFLIWALTGLIFFIKPGYGAAYESLATPQLPLADLELPQLPSALELRVMHTRLGTSLFVKEPSGWQHLDPATGLPKPEPTADALHAFFTEAVAAKSERYGEISAVDGLSATTSTGVRLRLDWSSLRISQYGKDTQRIDWFYKLHYLQWTGHSGVDKFLGVAGLFLLIAMTFSGAFLLFARSQKS